jgi:hypothetical protein
VQPTPAILRHVLELSGTGLQHEPEQRSDPWDVTAALDDAVAGRKSLPFG